ncbi:MAG: 1-acyl-sn-glycerol-3-phosphate acyltransferase [Spirochaetes bacterium]|nr:1-acyl-sn-glycerol-3-phosphate acyltransferase [Spirochaetota bacterium]
MIFVYYIYSLIVSILTLLLSLFYVITCWWFLFIPMYKKFKLFDYIVVGPWTSIVNRLFLGIRITVSGKEHVDKKRTTLYICNHQSWVDISVVNKYTHAVGVSKKQVRRLPLVGVLIIYASTIIVDRNDYSSRIGIVKELIKVFKKGVSIVLFPEGTRSRDGELLNPNYAVIKLCYKLNIPVVPAAIEGTRDVLPRNRIYFKFLQRVILKFTPPMYPKDFNNEQNFAESCWDKVKETHNEILRDSFPDKLSR